MNKTSFQQQFLLILFGFFLTLVILEAGLRLGGFLVLYSQEKHNHISFKKDEYRILCLGESTTALGGEDSYPSQLEFLLNEQSRQKKFSVINKGVISTTSDFILTHIDQNLDTYKPQMVVIMMGINDSAFLHDFHKTLWLENLKSCFKELRVCKLGFLIYEHLSHRMKNIQEIVKPVDLHRPESDEDQYIEDFLRIIMVNSLRRASDHLSKGETKFAKDSLVQAAIISIELARRYRLQGAFDQERKMLESAVIFDSTSPNLYQEWGEYYLTQNDGADAIKSFQTSLNLNTESNEVYLGLARAFHLAGDDRAYLFYVKYLQEAPKDYWGYCELAQWLREAKHDEAAGVYLNKAIDIVPNFEKAYLDLGQILHEHGQYRQEEDLYLKAISQNAHGGHVYQALGILYQKLGKKSLAQKYFLKAVGRQMPEYCPVTLVNYSLLVDKILRRHIKVIIMQYPMRDIAILKDYFGNRQGIIFVENNQNFKQALAHGGYWHYFKDNFAYDFGHCTRAGNELIARNLTGKILNQ